METHANLDNTEVYVKTTVSELNKTLKFPDKIAEFEDVLSKRDNEISQLELDKSKLLAKVDALTNALDNVEHSSLLKEVEHLRKELLVHQYYLETSYTKRGEFQDKWDSTYVTYRDNMFPCTKEEYDGLDKMIKDAESKGEILSQEYYQLREGAAHRVQDISVLVNMRRDADSAFVDPLVPDEIREEYESKFG